MSTLKISIFGFVLLLALITNPSPTLAQSITSTAIASSSSLPTNYNNNESNNLPSSSSSSPNDNPPTENPNTAGASGSSQTAISLNTGDIIAIGIVVGLVVILGIASAILFYLAKKRQWEVRASLRRSARRLTTAVRARTPMKANFSRRDREGIVRIDPPASSKNAGLKAKRSGGILKDGKPRLAANNNNNNNNNNNVRADRDVEKGFAPHAGLGTQTKIEAVRRPLTPPSSGSRPPGVPPKSSFEMDEPLTGSRRDDAARGKKGSGNAVWAKMWARK